MSQKELDQHYDKCYVSARVDTTKEKAASEKAQSNLTDAFVKEKQTKTASEQADAAAVEAKTKADADPYNLAKKAQATANEEQFVAQLIED